ncbi:TadE/TadG family type IV pilus assembly protein [Actinomadura atramentaria]|uniref:TadE/TadG family type IV pilus assembly protein n=1 Tax=Actinomadura atramentaria TaxID=1990 RepID=UPI00036DF61A|nr:TadE/TadG family type IV pilus assembly protein [Actinomadura atramentaria]
MSGRDRGAVEFVGMLPLVLTTVLLVWEAFLIGMAMTYSAHAANEGARVAAVGGGPRAVRDGAVERVYGTWADERNIRVRYPTGAACDDDGPRDPDCGYVRVSIRPPAVFPGLLLPATVSARTRIVDEDAP